MDPNAQAFISAAGITDSTQKRAINNLVKSLKGYGIWTKLQAAYPLVGGTSTTHKFNLKDPRDLDAAFRLSFQGGWTHDSNGATGNGTTNYADTFYNPVTQSTSTSSAHLSFYTGAAPTAGASKYFIGNSPATLINQFMLGFLVSGTLMMGGVACADNSTNRTPTSGTAAGPTAGMACVSCNGSRDQKYYLNGSSHGTSTTATGSFTSNNLYLGATNQNGSANFFFDKAIRWASIGTGLSATEAGNLFTAVEAYQDTLGRGVI
jgi:hypothetical protein